MITKTFHPSAFFIKYVHEVWSFPPHFHTSCIAMSFEKKTQLLSFEYGSVKIPLSLCVKRESMTACPGYYIATLSQKIFLCAVHIGAQIAQSRI